LSLSWVLSFLLVLAQHGAVLHELGHLHRSAASGGVSLTPELYPLQSTLCLTCEAFAQVSNPAVARAVDFAACPPAIIPSIAPCQSFRGADAPTARSRGPPQV
jgi:hypothetical protein